MITKKKSKENIIEFTKLFTHKPQIVDIPHPLKLCTGMKVYVAAMWNQPIDNVLNNNFKGRDRCI